MLAAGVVSSVAPSPLARARVSKGNVCPHCDAPSEHGASLCSYCGVTLGEPPRRSGMTQRAMALDAESARLALEALAPAVIAPAVIAASPTPIVVRGSSAAAPTRRAATMWERMFVVLTLGLGWLWVRRRIAQA